MTDNELKAAAYFAVGVSSEGSIAGRDVSYRLSFAGNVRNGVMDPVGNSGYSFGTLQIDLGQHPEVARQMLDNYQRWAATQPDRAAVELTRAGFDDTLEALQRTGKQMRAAGAHDIDRTNINRFLASDQGKEFVHGLDTQHVNGVTAEDTVRGNGDSALERLRRTDAYRNASDDDQAKLAGMFMKLQNQAGDGRWPGIMRRVEAGTLTTPDQVKTAIDALLPNQANGDPDYIQSGADNTLRGTAVLNALHNASPTNPLSQAWTNVVANPLVGPVDAHQPNPANPNFGFQYDTVRSLFLTPEASQRFIHALDRGETMAEGRPQPPNGSPQAGFFVAGRDFVHWNRDGHGAAYIGGQWSEIERSQISRVDRGNGVVDLNITRDGATTPLLHVDPRAPAQRAEQPQAQQPQQQPNESRPALSPTSQQLLNDSERHVRALADRHQLAWDQGMDNTVHAVAAEAREQGMPCIDHLKVKDGQICFAQQAKGEPLREAQIDAKVAANTGVDQSVGRMVQADQTPTRSATPAASEPALTRESALAH
ncbi:XVIPCD domain-containing protein [Hydrogenophaga sp. MI9]|uniref:XVIPCD domain-containing protein n=1 Tax=Hydrogenophaga sp. MI9 TaxID=3453719 RepID=UPI003EED5EFD